MKITNIGLLLFVLSGYVGSAFPAAEKSYEAIQDRVKKYTDKHADVSISFSLVYDGENILRGNYGPGHLDGDTIYRVGSLAKVMTALAILNLERQGKVDIDQPVGAYLPRFNVKRRFSDDRPITLRHILTHHSGLPTNIVKGQWSDAHFSTVVEQLRKEYLTYPPDFVMAYSNVGYSVLGALLEEVSGQSYESYIKEMLFDRLDMKNTGFSHTMISSPNFSHAVSNGSRLPLPPIRDIPAMGLYTSIDDMEKFLVLIVDKGAYGGERIIDEAVLEEIQEQQNENVLLDFDAQVGMGLALNHCKFKQPGNVIEHGGNTMHYSSHFVALPSYKLGAVVLSNSRESKSFVHKIANNLIAVALDKNFPNELIRQVENDEMGDPRPFESENIQPGTYLTRSGLLTLEADGEDLCGCIKDKRLDLVPLPDGWHELRNSNNKGIKISTQQVNGENVLVVKKNGEEQRLGEYILPVGVSDRWKNRLGDYEVANPDSEFPLTEVCLVEDDNLLYLSYKMPRLSSKTINLPLTILEDDQAITSGLGRGRGETLEAMQTDEGEYLLYSGYLVRKKPS